MSKNKIITAEMMFEQAKTYLSEESLALITKAYNYANEKHEGQFRKSGDPYIIHAIAVGYILATIHGGPKTIAAGLLHDVMEDCDVSRETMVEEFGEEITTLVEAVTKIGNIKFKDEKEYLAANHRKIFIAMAKDVRVILIKLVDRLHNMRTLNFMKPEKQKKIARETLEVYAPIAHRLGMSEIKNELEDLCFLYLEPQKYHEIAHLVEVKKDERAKLVEKMIEEISDMLNKHNFKFRIFGRSKHLYSIHKKMVTKNKRFEEILDLYAIRIITETELNCYEILGYIHAKYHPIPGRLKDYIAMPKMNMYQSLHTTIVADEGNIFEVQIRTEEMDAIAEQGVAAHWRYKEGKKYSVEAEQKEIEEKLAWYRDLTTMTDDVDVSSPEDYMNVLQRDIFEANVYVMSPLGRVIDLPNGSTPLDFAYRIHTEVGHSTIGALVNGYLVPLNTELKTGDVVQIRTSKQSNGPSEDWLKIVKTAHARNKIKSFLQKKENENRAQFIEKGETMLRDELIRRNFDDKIWMDKGKIENVCNQFTVSNYNDLMYAIAVKSVNLQQVIERLTNQKMPTLLDNLSLTKLFQSRPKEVKKVTSNIGVSVEGIDSMMISFAGCCKPVYGDEIVGFISKGQGVKVHRKDCPNIIREQRLINVYWDESAESKTYEANLLICANDRNYLISDIVTIVSQCKVRLIGINSHVQNDRITAVIKLTVEVHSLEHLRVLIANVKKLNSITAVERVLS
ncbi:MAG: bifunctional (p)ppGpp synthetase/guanosine-3',5'-bis(diphosphate) 3'-pyrophosphohydrolase [Erysipelotrichaceae bacterium]|nr:bifunctional (p)ppGpp synthetase/guanosine-3',5'-bis(diphosphate) 3'-pyrophosphohydrolase [Erysipelotrichaceae bacterium]